MNGLELSGVSVRYGGVTAVRDVALAVEPGFVLGLIGPNGAGKTSLINAVTGIVGIDAGSIRLGGKRIDGIPPHRIARAGIARTYQNIRLFGALDVRTNLAAGAFTQKIRLTKVPYAGSSRASISPMSTSTPPPHRSVTATSDGWKLRARSPRSRR